MSQRRRSTRLTVRKKSKTQKKKATSEPDASKPEAEPEDAPFEPGSPSPSPPTLLPADPLDPDWLAEDNLRSQSITPPPIVVTGKKTRTRAVTVSDSDSSETKAPAKKAKKNDGKVLDAAEHKLILMIPRAKVEGNQRQVLTHATTFSKALENIHETLGCTDIPVKPELMYKLSSATVKAPPIGLTSDDDWDGLLEEVTTAKKKKSVTVNIVVTEQYLASLRVKLRVKNVGPKLKGKGASKMAILDLEHAESGDDDFDEGLGIMEKKRTCLEQLQTKHSRCQLCGPDVACKINVSGAHCKLSNNQLRAWANLLAHGTHNVTLVTPPNSEMFGKFFKNSNFHKAGSTAMSSSQSPFPQYPPFMSMHPFAPMMPWGMPPPAYGTVPPTPMTPTPPARGSASSSTMDALPSSDPPEIGIQNPYPKITAFLTELHGYMPRSNLLQCIPTFENMDLFNIDEIAKLGTPQDLVRHTSGFVTLGNATYILEQVKAQMKRIDVQHAARASR